MGGDNAFESPVLIQLTELGSVPVGHMAHRVRHRRLKRPEVAYERSNTFDAPDSGTTSGSRQTLITGEACRRACGVQIWP